MKEYSDPDNLDADLDKLWEKHSKTQNELKLFPGREGGDMVLIYDQRVCQRYFAHPGPEGIGRKGRKEYISALFEWLGKHPKITILSFFPSVVDKLYQDFFAELLKTNTTLKTVHLSNACKGFQVKVDRAINNRVTASTTNSLQPAITSAPHPEAIESKLDDTSNSSPITAAPLR